jgi:Phytanoyl-CoA dioxygenase (PhyH)
MFEMSDREKFLFDLQGYLVIPGLLSASEVSTLNEAVDANDDKVVDDPNMNVGESHTLSAGFKRRMLGGVLTLPHPWCDPFRALLAHPGLVPYLNTMLGPGWRMDHAPMVFIADQDAEGLVLHGATAATTEVWPHARPKPVLTLEGRAPDFARSYQYANGMMRCGLIAIEFNLTPHAEGDGGFAVIPGSHKSNFAVPMDIRLWEGDRDIVRNPAGDPGDVIIFNEAVVHGTLPWRAAHQRRAVLYRYSPRYLNYAGGYNTTILPEWASELTPAQLAVLEPAHTYGRPIIQDDGVTVVFEERRGGGERVDRREDVQEPQKIAAT